MNEAAQAEPKEYPESWDEHAQAGAESDHELKLKHGDNVRVHVVSGPLTYREDYIVVGKKEDGKTDKKKRIALPFASQLPGYKLKVKYMVEVIILDGVAKGQSKIFCFGKQVADDLAKVKQVWGSVRTPDIVLSRTGSTKDDTKYSATAAPSTVQGVPPVKFNLEAEVRFSTKADIDQLPPPVTAKETPDSLSGQLSGAQIDLIDSLCKEKEVSRKDLTAMIERKFKKSVPLTDLTMGEASAIIDLLKNY